jgi:hypothetical protein
MQAALGALLSLFPLEGRLPGELTTSQLASKHGLHQTMAGECICGAVSEDDTTTPVLEMIRKTRGQSQRARSSRKIWFLSETVMRRVGLIAVPDIQI